MVCFGVFFFKDFIDRITFLKKGSENSGIDS